MLLRPVVGLIALAALLLQVVPATAAAAAVSSIQRFHKVINVEAEIDPCSRTSGTFTETITGVIHITEQDATYHLTGTVTGTATFVPDDPSVLGYTGRFTFRFGENVSRSQANGTVTFQVQAIAADGSSLKCHGVMHYTVNPGGIVTVAFDRLRR